LVQAHLFLDPSRRVPMDLSLSPYPFNPPKKDTKENQLVSHAHHPWSLPLEEPSPKLLTLMFLLCTVRHLLCCDPTLRPCTHLFPDIFTTPWTHLGSAPVCCHHRSILHTLRFARRSPHLLLCQSLHRTTAFSVGILGFPFHISGTVSPAISQLARAPLTAPRQPRHPTPSHASPLRASPRLTSQHLTCPVLTSSHRSSKALASMPHHITPRSSAPCSTGSLPHFDGIAAPKLLGSPPRD
jgi:hypothetical protein